MTAHVQRLIAVIVAIVVAGAVAIVWLLHRPGPQSSNAVAVRTSSNGRESDTPTSSHGHRKDRDPTSSSGSSSETRGTPQASPTVVGGSSTAGLGAPSSTAVTCPEQTTRVTDAASLKAALESAQPGSVIELADGTYSGQFTTNRSGSASMPAWLCGDSGAVLDGGSVRKGYVLHLQSARYWRLVGFTVRNGQKGVVVDDSTGSVVQGLTVSDIGDEAIHLRSATTHTVVRGNTISNTGQRSKKFGEGIYVGSAKSNWCKYSACLADRSNYDTIADNHISATSAESIDIKEGTQNGVIEGNTFDGAGGLTGADSWVDVKGNNWLIAHNSGKNSPTDGFQVHNVVPGWGNNNVFIDNSADVQGSGYGYHLAPIQNNVVYCNNTASNAPLGMTNAPCRKQ